LLKSRTPTAEEKEWLELSHLVPCLACALFHDTHDTPAEYHHVNGKMRIDAHRDGYSLCEKHHRVRDNQHPKRWISRHGDGRTLFEARYMPEGAFVQEQRRAVEALKKSFVGGK
jgi:hypothetical protein